MNQISQNDFRALLLAMGLLMVNALPAQVVENRGCPVTYNRNNGNGQYVSVFASNISPNSIYAQAALTSGNQGNFTFTWGSPVVNPPVINRSWVTSASGVTSLNWTFGNNSNGSPFNPPGVPAGTDVKYTFYNNNLPTAGTISFEFADPYDGRVINTCSYPLSNGSTSSGSLVSLAVTPPSGLSFSVNNPASNFGSNGRSVKPQVNGGGGTVVFSLQNNPAGVTIENATGEVSWNNTIAPGNYSFTVKGSNGIEPDATAGMSLTVHSIPVVAAITGSNLVAVDSLVQLACTTPDGAWSTSDAGVATVTAAGRVKGVGVGRSDISYTVTNRVSLKNVRFTGKGTRIPVAGAPLMAYPSPAADHVNLLFNAATSERVTVCLISAATGQLVFRQMAQAVQGVNSLRFGWGVKPAPGLYIIRVQGATRHYQSSIIIQP